MSVMHLDEKNFQEEINSGSPVVIDFWASWCGPCQMMGPVFEELSEEYGSKARFAKVNVDENRQISQERDIQGIPCIIVMKDGKELGRVVGFRPKDSLKQEIDALIG